MVFGEDAEDPEEDGPDADEEEHAQQHDLPRLRVVRRPEVGPVAAVGGRQEIVLDDDGHKKPQDDLAPEQAGIKTRHGAGGLAVVVWQTEEHDGAGGPHQHGDGDRDVRDGDAVGKVAAVDHVALGGEARGLALDQDAAPVPQRDDVGLLRALDDAGAVDPGFDGRAALVAEIQGEEDGAGRGSDGVEARRDVLDPVFGVG